MSNENATELNVSGSPDTNLIYADRIYSFGIGPGVTKLHFGLEGSTPEMVNALGTLVLPTHSLIESLKYILSSIETNKDLRQQLTTQIDNFRAQVQKN